MSTALNQNLSTIISTIIEGFIETQLIQFRIMRIKFVNLDLSGSPGPSDNPEKPETSGQNSNNATNNNETPKFLNNDINFFDLFYDNKFNKTTLKIKHAKKKKNFEILLYLSTKLKM